MEINRRQFLMLSSAMPLINSSSIFAYPETLKILGCRSDHDGNHFFSMIGHAGKTELNVQLPQRGHGICVSSDKRLAAITARRPGDYVWVVDLNTEQVSNKIAAARQRHFYGHAVFTHDGSLLLCSENEYASGKGVIGVYDTHNNFARIGEFSSFGIGPHEIKLLSNGKTLVVANGGIQTHPDSPRVKLNLETMRPILAYIDIANGHLLHKHELDPKFHQLSIRHLDITSNDTVAIAMQSQGDPYLHPPLIAIQQGHDSIKTLTAPDEIQNRLRNYCGSVAFSKEGNVFAVTSPRGGLVTFWSNTGSYLGMHNQADACGVSHSAGNLSKFLISDGTGVILQIKNNFQPYDYHKSHKWRWDNHLFAL